MPVTLRKRRQCHGCGNRLNTVRREGNKIWCDRCHNINYFDANDNITDVPTEEVTRAAGQSSGPEIASESSIFCKTCLTNQYFYNRALADYLPDEDDPRYEQLENGIPQFKRELDLRYPQCCARCEPRVQAQIQRANYTAKSDHLRRMLHRKHGRRKTAGLRLRSLFVSAAGFGQSVSLAVHLLWHALSSQEHSSSLTPGLDLRQCLHRPVPVQCTNYAASLVPFALVTALLSIWWNPKWQHKLMGREGRLVGLRKYYQLQLFSVTSRFVTWIFVSDLPSVNQYTTSMHTLFFVLLAMTAVYSMTVVKVDTTPLVDWSKVQRPLVDPEQFQPPQQQASPPSSQTTHPLQHFPIGILASPARQTYEPWRPPTPPSTEGDSMDWAPTIHNFDPQPRMPKPKSDQPSPFYGTLPAAPARGSLNPKAPPPPQKRAIGLPPGFFGLSRSREQPPGARPNEPHENVFAPANFFGHEREADTGLENIFDRMFSVRDPLETNSPDQQANAPVHKSPRRKVSQRSASGMQTQSSNLRIVRMVVSCIIIVAFATMVSNLVTVNYMQEKTATIPSAILPYTAVIPALHLLDEAVQSAELLFTSLAISALELVFAISMRYLIPAKGSDYVAMWNKMVMCVICLYLLQEVYHFCQLQYTPVSSVATEQMVASMERAEQQQPPEPTLLDDMSAPSHPTPQPQHHSQQYPTSQPQPQHTIPTAISRYPPTAPRQSEFSSLRPCGSNESISSVSSIATTSTAPGWKTPQHSNRTYDWQSSNNSRSTPRHPSNNLSRGLGGLNLGNDFAIASGAGVAGPRSSGRQARGSAGANGGGGGGWGR